MSHERGLGRLANGDTIYPFMYRLMRLGDPPGPCRRTGDSVTTLPATAAGVLSGHVEFGIEPIDRMHLNLYQPRLQTATAIAAFFIGQHGNRFASSASASRSCMTPHWVRHREFRPGRPPGGREPEAGTRTPPVHERIRLDRHHRGGQGSRPGRRRVAGDRRSSRDSRRPPGTQPRAARTHCLAPGVRHATRRLRRLP